MNFWGLVANLYVQLNFYSFQIRESKKNKIVEMRKKFEEDKQKINRMKQERKFKPVAS